MTETLLTSREIEKISLGYTWSPEMSFDDFSTANSNVSRADAFEIFEMIEHRYIHYKFEVK